MAAQRFPIARSRFVILSLASWLLVGSLACSSSDEKNGQPPKERNATGSGESSDGTGGSSERGASSSPSSGGSGAGSRATPPGENTGGSGSVVPSGPSHVVVVAHQDDDLLFINPDLKRAMDAGEPLSTIYLTSGNAGEGMVYVEERERGIQSAYAFMANATNSWNCGPQTYAGKSLQTCKLDAKDVQLIFFRLVDGFGNGTEPESLKNLWLGNIERTQAVDGSGLSFSRAELTSSLSAILAENGASEVYTTDFSFEHRDNDHSDHENAALFTIAASALHERAHGLHSYITYSTKDFAPNLSNLDTALVSDTFAHYASCDKFIDGCSGGLGCEASMCATSSQLYTSWFSRHYSNSRLKPSMTAMVQNLHFSGACLGHHGGAVTLSSCGSADLWTWNDDYSLRTSNDQCLTAPSGPLRSAQLEPCNGGDHQRWFIMDNGQIILGAQPGPGESEFQLSQCLDGGTAIDSPVVVMNCGTDPALDWSF